MPISERLARVRSASTAWWNAGLRGANREEIIGCAARVIEFAGLPDTWFELLATADPDAAFEVADAAMLAYRDVGDAIGVSRWGMTEAMLLGGFTAMDPQTADLVLRHLALWALQDPDRPAGETWEILRPVAQHRELLRDAPVRLTDAYVHGAAVAAGEDRKDHPQDQPNDQRSPYARPWTRAFSS